jgi:hypothetical protein
MIGAYSKAPPFAWSGWRLSIPGGPEGGQYHGFIGPDSSGWTPPGTHPKPAAQPAPWDDVWGGTALKEGQNRSDYVYRSSAEMRPRPNASGGANVVQSFQTEKSAGYAEAPGAYKSLGLSLPPNIVSCPDYDCSPVIGRGPGPCFSPICGTNPGLTTGATSTVAQPPAPSGTPGGTLVPYSIPPVSPAPSPVVTAPAGAYLPSNGQPLPAAAAADPVSAWLSASTVIPGVENIWVAAGAAVAAYVLFKGSL